MYTLPVAVLVYMLVILVSSAGQAGQVSLGFEQSTIYADTEETVMDYRTAGAIPEASTILLLCSVFPLLLIRKRKRRA